MTAVSYYTPEGLKKLRDATSELVERSKKVSKSDAVFDLEKDPQERVDLSEKFPAIKRALLKKYQDFLKNFDIYLRYNF